MKAAEASTAQVYFMHDSASHKVKIGFSGDVGRRQTDVQAHNGNDLLLLGALAGGRQEERRLHEMFEQYRVSESREWFHAPDDVIHAIRLLLIRGGTPQTVQDELERRSDCRYGLRGVLVAVRGHGAEVFAVRHTQWDRDGKLVVNVSDLQAYRVEEDQPPRTMTLGQLIANQEPEKGFDVSGADCFLLSDWPVVCGCWL